MGERSSAAADERVFEPNGTAAVGPLFPGDDFECRPNRSGIPRRPRLASIAGRRRQIEVLHQSRVDEPSGRKTAADRGNSPDTLFDSQAVDDGSEVVRDERNVPNPVRP